VVESNLELIVWAVIALVWLYIATRMITRGVMRSIEEWKERKHNNGQEKKG